MPYGQIFRNLTAAGGAITHTMGSANFCVFLIQDTTTAGAARALPALFTSGKTATDFTVTDGTLAGACNYDALVVEPHSILDIGPAVNGITRAPTNVYTVNSTTHTPAYRSLHYNVDFECVNGTANTDVIITHLLHTASTMAFVSPTLDPRDPGDNDVVKVFVSGTAADTTTLRCVRGAGGNFQAAGPGTHFHVTFDVMILARTAAATVTVAPQPITMGQHLATAGANTGLWSDDYSGADTARAVDPTATGIPTYACLYSNVDGIVAGGVAITHNLRSATGLMMLVGHTVTPGLGAPVITNNATSTTTITVARVGADMNDNNVYVLRPHPMLFQAGN